MSLFDWLLIGHLVGDFLIQSDNMARSKQHRPMMLGHISFYMVVMTPIIVIYALTHSLPVWLIVAALLFLAGTHVSLDRRDLTVRWMRFMGMSPNRLWLVIVVDQVLHLLTLAIVAQVLVLFDG